MSAFVVAPDGKVHGPFADRDEALQFGKDKWPTAICGERREDPAAWEIRLVAHDTILDPELV